MNYKIVIQPREKLSSKQLSELVQWFEEEFGHIPIQWADPEYYVFAISDSEIISRLGIIERKVSVNEHPLNVAGISGVITRSEYRKSGIASYVLKNAVAFISNDLGINYGLLLCRDEVASVYEKLGWKVFDGPTTFHQPNGKMIYHKLTMVLECGQEKWPIGAIDLCGLPW
jgi:predicted acetyltransferase